MITNKLLDIDLVVERIAVRILISECFVDVLFGIVSDYFDVTKVEGVEVVVVCLPVRRKKRLREQSICGILGVMVAWRHHERHDRSVRLQSLESLFVSQSVLISKLVTQIAHK